MRISTYLGDQGARVYVHAHRHGRGYVPLHQVHAYVTGPGWWPR